MNIKKKTKKMFMKEKFYYICSRILKSEGFPSFFDILAIIFCAGLLLFCVLSISSCSLINRSSASGSRYVEKTVKQEQFWSIPPEGMPNQINTIETYKKEI